MDFNLLNGMIDTHFHGLVMQQKGLNTIDILSTSIKMGLSAGIDIGLTPDDFLQRKKLFKDIRGIKMSAGCYPSEIEKKTISKLVDDLEQVLRTEKVTAVGEIGLDWYWDYGTRREQKELLAKQIHLANSYNLPVIIHNREADKDITDLLYAVKPSSGGILHCFSSDYATAKKLLDIGMYISFAGNLTYKKNSSLRDTAIKIPIKRIFLETDSPYLSPQKQRGIPNHPGHIGYTYEVLSEILRMEISFVIEQIQINFNLLFGKQEQTN